MELPFEPSFGTLGELYNGAHRLDDACDRCEFDWVSLPWLGVPVNWLSQLDISSLPAPVEWFIIYRRALVLVRVPAPRTRRVGFAAWRNNLHLARGVIVGT